MPVNLNHDHSFIQTKIKKSKLDKCSNIIDYNRRKRENRQTKAIAFHS